jgi:hypothetical protein
MLIFLPLLAGCGGSDLLAYIGGGLPPGDGDIGGVVLASVPAESAVNVAQAETVPVVGAEVMLYRGQRLVGRTETGEGGFFRFQDPPTGQFEVRVEPPAGSQLQQARRQFQHQGGQQTFLTIVLEPESGGGGSPGPGPGPD